ncbi:ATP-binding protein [Streptomyces sp. bgisy100]|uniref:ATP-binding protein n=1 Tax=Streptomyces sp. bgisy100 TaxID=3413783 RepID=UPI003D756327
MSVCLFEVDQTDSGYGAEWMAHQREESVLNKRLRESDLTAVSDVRHALRELLGRWSWGGPDQADVAELLISELVTNALVHTDSGAEVTAVLVQGRVARTANRLRVEVRDFVPRRPAVRKPGSEATGGRGLVLVESLADSWGVQPQGPGKVVWFELEGRAAA